MTDFRPLPTGRRPRIAVLDDYMGVAHRLASWSKVQAGADVDFLHEPIAPGKAGVEQLRGYDAICLLRERTAFPAELLAQQFGYDGLDIGPLKEELAAVLGSPVAAEAK